jgi:hypothetical protein
MFPAAADEAFREGRGRVAVKRRRRVAAAVTISWVSK